MNALRFGLPALARSNPAPGGKLAAEFGRSNPMNPSAREGMYRLRRSGLFWLAVLSLALFFAGAASAQAVLKLATTTSTDNSGLLNFLLPEFERTANLKVQVIAVGSGKALELAKNGDVDVVLVHARAAEDSFVAAGHGINRRDVMHNDFLLAGPETDPARLRGGHDVLAAMRKIIATRTRFISRGDNSGTDQMEQGYWKQIGDKPVPPQYVSAGLGMGEVLSMAAELQAYTLTDRATYAAYRAKTGLEILVEGDARLLNRYGVIAVNPAKYKDIQFQRAMQFINWLTSETGQKRIAQFKISGEQVFFPANSSQGKE